MRNRPNKRQTKKKKKPLHEAVSVVGPECIQVLQGKLRCSNNNNKVKDVSLVLCGEAHYDAIDVTRRGGRVYAKEGWVMRSLEQRESPASIKLMKESRKLQPLSQAQTWATEWIDCQDSDNEPEWHTMGCQLLLLWFPLDLNSNKTNKGKAYIVEMREEGFDDDDSSKGSNTGCDNGRELPTQIAVWREHIMPLERENSSKSEISYNKMIQPKVFEWGDLDDEARELNKRRLSDEHIATSELDSIVEQRKLLRKQENIWTFDDWFSHVQAKQQDDDTGLFLILEAAVPPWEVELERTNEQIQPANDVIRCVSRDSEPSTVDEYDPTMDGVGSYMDFCYRKFMNQMLAEQQSEQTTTQEELTTSTWLHCVDIRDLGCESACHAESVKCKWINLLSPMERRALLNEPCDLSNDDESKDLTTDNPLFEPASLMNPELHLLWSLRATGVVKPDTDCEDNDKDDAKCHDEEEHGLDGTFPRATGMVKADTDCEDNDANSHDEEEHGLDFTLPSFEAFFGLSTDFLYYSPHVKVLFSPFLAKCCKNLKTWEDFVMKLFFGGTISDALGLLDLDHGEDGGGQFVHVRSPILKQWDFATGQYLWEERDESSEYITSPYFPHVFYLKARDCTPPRTWSSQLYSQLTSDGDGIIDSDNVAMSVKNVAESARAWVIARVKRSSDDPKGADDVDCGGEWFHAYLRAAFSDIYKDVETFDSVTLAQKNYLPSVSQGRRKKYNVGKIKIPSTKQMFEEILAFYQDDPLQEKGNESLPSPVEETRTISPRVESLSKILIDIWMSSLVDFSTLLKVTSLVNASTHDRVVVVLYMGTVHVKAVADFYTQQVGFRKTSFVGKYSWDDEEVKTLKLPSSLWDLSRLS